MRAPRWPETLCALRLREPNHSTLTSDALCRPTALPQEPLSRVRCLVRSTCVGARSAFPSGQDLSTAARFRRGALDIQSAFRRLESRPFRRARYSCDHGSISLKHLDTLSPIRVGPHVTAAASDPLARLRSARLAAHFASAGKMSLTSVCNRLDPSAPSNRSSSRARLGVSSLSRAARRADPFATSREQCFRAVSRSTACRSRPLCDPHRPRPVGTTRGRKPDHCWSTLPRMRDFA
jgi:hypothetical protein